MQFHELFYGWFRLSGADNAEYYVKTFAEARKYDFEVGILMGWETVDSNRIPWMRNRQVNMIHACEAGEWTVLYSHPFWRNLVFTININQTFGNSNKKGYLFQLE